MAMYHDLVKEYSGEIAEIKTRQTEHDVLVEQLSALPEPILHPEPDYVAIGQLDELADKASVAHDDLMVAWEILSQSIEAEYANVPFDLTARQGIDGFWREAGLN